MSKNSFKNFKDLARHLKFSLKNMGQTSTQCSKPSSLNEDEIKLLLESTSMSREQIVDFYQNFLKDCPNGVLKKKEFCRLFKELHNNDLKTQKVEKFAEYVFK
jgi:Ca2+-binding EF-hand superfamily protein